MPTLIPPLIRPPELIIPPRPQAMMVLMEEMPKAEPDLRRVTQAIQADPALAGAMLKAVNSPAFGLSRKAGSIAQALSFLGLRNIHTIAAGVALRQAMAGPNSPMLERFWDTAEKTALICSELAQRLRGIPKDQAYTAGLFHDCGIPMLMQRFPHYRDTLARANHGEGKSFDEVEELDLGTNHCSIGYFVARSWNLPDSLCHTILWHHNPQVFAESAGCSPVVRSYVGLIHFAEHIQHTQMRSGRDIEWDRFGDHVLAHFSLTGEDYLNLVDAVQEALDDEMLAAA
jgi:HD-like signal output (HDOD) protein